MAQFDGMDSFTKGYIVCALWSSTDESDDAGGLPMDVSYTVDDIADETIEKIKRDCVDFQQANGTLLQQYYDSGFCAEYAGHDFWLTRNGHGAGFWDRRLNELGDKLTEQCRVYGDCNLYVGDDGMIYSM